jgi:GDP-4-dehydro-6-deoxy-D-mannose reductase
LRAVITGITGFAGQYLAQHLLAEGDEVLGFNRTGVWPADSLPGLRDAVQLEGWDVTQPANIGPPTDRLRAFEPDCIYHLAAKSVPEDCGRHMPAAPAAAVNIGGTTAVLELAASLRRSTRVLFVSTSHVYASPADPDRRLSEDDPVKPRNGYGWSKWLAETVLGGFIRYNGADALVVRAFQHTGPRQHPRMMLAGWAQQFAQPMNGPVQVYNRTTQIDLTDVRDVVRAYRLLMQAGTSGQVYNVGSGVAHQTGQILEWLQEIAGPGREIVELYPGVKHDPLADIERVRTATGWQPHISLQKCIADTFSYWRNQFPDS